MSETSSTTANYQSVAPTVVIDGVSTSSSPAAPIDFTPEVTDPGNTGGYTYLWSAVLAGSGGGARAAAAARLPSIAAPRTGGRGLPRLPDGDQRDDGLSTTSVFDVGANTSINNPPESSSTPTVSITESDPDGEVLAGSPAHFTVQASGPVTVFYTAIDGTALADLDYTALGNGSDVRLPRPAGVDLLRLRNGYYYGPDIQDPTATAPLTFQESLNNLLGLPMEFLSSSATATILPAPVVGVVNSTGDSPAKAPSLSPWTGGYNVKGVAEVTLRSEIQYLDATGGGTVDFDIPDVPQYCQDNVYTITTSGLPALTEPITVDGTSQPGYWGTPVIDVVGESGGFIVDAGPSTVDALAVTGSGGTGVTVDDAAGHDTVEDCYIGVEPDGTTAGCNIGYGVEINNSSDKTIEDDVVSANSAGGIHITGSGSQSNSIEGDDIGTNAAGTAALGTQALGVLIDGGAQSNTVESNVISGNTGDGVSIDGSQTLGNSVAGNWIGTNDSSTPDIGNYGDGVSISGGAGTNTIGGRDSSAGNVIADNDGNGVKISGSAACNFVEANWIGTDENSSPEWGTKATA